MAELSFTKIVSGALFVDISGKNDKLGLLQTSDVLLKGGTIKKVPGTSAGNWDMLEDLGMMRQVGRDPYKRVIGYVLEGRLRCGTVS